MALPGTDAATARPSAALSLDEPLAVIPAPREADPRPGISGVEPEQLVAWFVERGQPAYRARQVADQLWRKSLDSFAAFRTLPATLRTALDETFRLDTLLETVVRPADEGLTQAALHVLGDGRTIESVLMRYPAAGPRRQRATVCISSQAGCAVGCPFCATGEMGFWRDLTTAEMVDQVRFWASYLRPGGEHVTNVVFMGMGEPLLNTERVLAAAAALSDPRRFGLGARHITISTSGVVPGIERLTEQGARYTLAVSLHAARSALRDLLVPLNRRWPADAVVAAAAEHALATGRRITYEYVMIGGINDTPNDAVETARLLGGQPAHVNLIPMNPVAHTPWLPSPPDRIEAFAAILRSAGLRVTVRRNRGIEIGAACGQLAAERAAQPTPRAVARRMELIIQRTSAALGTDAPPGDP